MAILKTFRNKKCVFENINLDVVTKKNRPTDDQIRQAYSEIYGSLKRTDIKKTFNLFAEKLGCTVKYLRNRFQRLRLSYCCKLSPRFISDEMRNAFIEIHTDENGWNRVLSEFFGCTKEYFNAHFRKFGLSTKFPGSKIREIHQEISNELSNDHRINVCAKYQIKWKILSRTFLVLGLQLPRTSATMINWDNITDLGKIPDNQLAKKLNVSRETIRLVRLKRGIPKFKKHDFFENKE